MFHAVRQWWIEGRGKLTVRLFVFELSVVILGVLIAQGLANWVQSRGDRAEAQRLHDDVMTRVEVLLRDFNYWGKYGPCLRRHIAFIARTAGDGGTLSDRQIGRPGLPMPREFNLSAEEWRKIRLVAPDDTVNTLIALSPLATRYAEFNTEISRHWAVLRLLDSQLGPPSAADRAQVRLSAMAIDSHVRWMVFQHASMGTGTFAGEGLPETAELPNADRLVDRCGLLKDWR